MADSAITDPGRSQARTVPLARGLSTKLLVLTAIFVLFAEILIFLPSIAYFRLRWLEERLGTAAAVSVLLVQNNSPGLSRDVQDEVLRSMGVKAIAIRDGGESRMLVASEVPQQVDEHIDLGNTGPVVAMREALDTLVFGGNRILRVFGHVGDSEKEFELIITDHKLRKAMLTYSRNVALLSLLISLFTATLVFYAIDRIMIRPIRDMTRSMLTFSQAPDDPGSIITPEPRADEIGVAERELSDMQLRLQRTLGEQKHLADLGLAVSKINHDMRNILASAQLMSDRLSMVKDPTVQSLVPKLVRALNRAVSYSEGVITYGRTQEAPPSRRRLRLRQTIEDVQGLLGIEPEGDIEFENLVAADFEIDADSEQLVRVLTNLCRNSLQAMAGDKESAIVKRLSISAERNGSVSRILVADTGPGLPQKARENLFSAFRGSARSGGTGLGLAIAYELVRAHGGTLELVESVGGRTVFSITIPDQPVRLDEARTNLRRPA
ncbi:signal transduction histidine kinase [Mesorhizobium soli]|uniref:HAMP domain-containing sensor histidine kinase n=1 Tax=Pseudaminobacter soli (ex Li et al. 2025) TaxID=1295366 RepID=UPI002473A73B|nr:HAMP domain-containing sensor histidine kinase [Mesorhizobium soli]MDH6230882.1 signal transduction histidine kinase [Mesorhizobium soli]